MRKLPIRFWAAVSRVLSTRPAGPFVLSFASLETYASLAMGSPPLMSSCGVAAILSSCRWTVASSSRALPVRLFLSSSLSSSRILTSDLQSR